MNKAEYDFSLRLYKNKTIEIYELHYFVAFSAVGICMCLRHVLRVTLGSTFFVLSLFGLSVILLFSFHFSLIFLSFFLAFCGIAGFTIVSSKL